MKDYLIRDESNWNTVYGVISLESEDDWNKAKEYLRDCRNNGREDESDSELIEEYFQMNDIEYEWIDFDGEVTL